MKLSPHFTLEELTITQVRSVSNDPSANIVSALTDTAMKMEAVRSVLGDKPILVSSGYRSPLVNRIVGGSPTSAHMAGRAVDFICPGFGTPLDVARAIVASDIKFDQIIEEGTWVHLSFDARMRRQVLSKGPSGLTPGLPEEPSIA